MMQLPFGRLISSAHQLSAFNQTLALNSAHEKIRMDDAGYFQLHYAASDFKICCEEIGLIVTLSLAERAFNEIDAASKEDGLHALTGTQIRRLHTTLTSLVQCLQSEAATKATFVLRPEKVKLFEQLTPPFGEEVASKFPILAYDISEASKCLGLGRSTAAVFHLLRCTEGVMRAMSTCLGIPDPTRDADRNWGAALKKIKDAIDKKKQAGLALPGDKELFERSYALLEAVRNPYRNATMHVEAVYTEEEAETIFSLVGGFIRQIAQRMDESGQPLA